MVERAYQQSSDDMGLFVAGVEECGRGSGRERRADHKRSEATQQTHVHAVDRPGALDLKQHALPVATITLRMRTYRSLTTKPTGPYRSPCV